MSSQIADISLKREGELLVAIGLERGWLGQSLYQQIICEKLEGAPPPVDLADEIKAGRLVRSLIRERQGLGRARHLGRRAAGRGCRDGAGVGRAGQRHRRRAVPLRGQAAGARHLVRRGPGPLCASPSTRSGAEEVLERARLLALPARIVGRTAGTGHPLRGEATLPLTELAAVHEKWLPEYMKGEV